MRVFCLLACFFFLACPAIATEAENAGEQLFRSTTLGSNGKSCQSCHPSGKGLENSADFESEMLREIINFCIRDALKGEMLPLDAAELKSLESYVLKFSKKHL